jgi:hypothetical protein
MIRRPTLHVLTIFFITLSWQVCGQTGTVTGTVSDARTKERLPFANVYINRTTLGTPSRDDGSFRINGIPHGQVEVVCSMVGYKTSSQSFDLKPGEVIEIEFVLQPVSSELQTVTVEGEKDKEWEKNLAAFKKVFLGRDDLAAQCVIANPNVLEFSKLKPAGMSAVASAPLEIINQGLGYKVTYELNHFQFTAQTYAIAGNIKFEQLLAPDSATTHRWTRSRKQVYVSSLPYLMKSMIEGRIRENGFEVYTETGYGELRRSDLFARAKAYLLPLTPASVITPMADSLFYQITLPYRLEVHDKRSNRGTTYRDVTSPVSWLEVSEPLFVTPHGIVQNPRAIQLVGYMTEFRIAHLLPEDYRPERAELIELLVTPPVLSKSLTENIYLHTDKDYYYQGDAVWLKGYMRYGDPRRADSLSRVVYVELIDSAKKVVLRQTYPIDQRSFNGKISIPNSMPGGNYFLRSYTQWMRNFGDDQAFIKPLQILDTYTRIENEGNANPPKTKYHVTIEPHLSKVKKRSEVALDIRVVDEFGNDLASDLSIGVVDYGLFLPVEDASLMSSVFRKDSIPPSFEYKFPVETGISIKGKFNAKKKLTEPVSVTAVLDKFVDINSFATDADGRFVVSGFQFADSSTIYLQVLDKNKKPYGTFSLTPLESPPIKALPPPLKLRRYATSSAVRIYSDPADDAIVLEEVTVTAKKTNKYQDMYGKGDTPLSGDDIRASNAIDLVNYLQRRAAGVRVYTYVDGMGMIRESIRLSGRSADPLLVIDGVAYSSSMGMDVARMIRQISVQEVDRIEILKFGAAAIYGSRGGDGVIVIYTKGQYSDATEGNNGFSTKDFIACPVKGYENFRPFTVPDYSKENTSDKEDTRTTLYWNPDLWLDGTGGITVKFPAGDVSSTYLVTVKGVTISGEPVSGTVFFSVTD